MFFGGLGDLVAETIKLLPDLMGKIFSINGWLFELAVQVAPSVLVYVVPS